MPAIVNLQQLCELCAPVYLALGYAPPTGEDVIAALVEEDRKRTALLNAAMKRNEGRVNERTLLRDGRGSSYGEVKAEIPQDLYFHLRDKRNRRFGPESVKTAAGIQEILKAYPECAVRNVNLKHHGHNRAGRGNYTGINWRGSSMKFAD